MSSMSASGNIVAVVEGLRVDCYDSTGHKFYDAPNKLDSHEDCITDVTISSNNKYLAFITSVSKQLIVCRLPHLEKCMCAILPRSASKLRFATNSEQILVADKSGDVFMYNIKDEDSGTKLLGHLSLLLDVLQTNDGKYIITCDRDEKIKVSCYPNTYNIQTYCLGHKEFVNHIELLPNGDKFLTSSSGDGTLKVWNYINGTLVYSIDAWQDVDDAELSKRFVKAMDEEGVTVSTLPIVHYAITKLNATTSILAVTLHSMNKLLIYTLCMKNDLFQHKKVDALTLEDFPTAIAFNNKSLIIYNSNDSSIIIMSFINTNDNIMFHIDKKIKMFEENSVSVEVKSSFDIIKVLYKRKFDNVQEYQERKKQRLEKSLK